MDLQEIQTRSQYAKYEKWGIYAFGMHDTIRNSIPYYEINDYYDWRTKIRKVIIDIKFGPPGLVRFQVLRLYGL